MHLEETGSWNVKLWCRETIWFKTYIKEHSRFLKTVILFSFVEIKFHVVSCFLFIFSLTDWKDSWFSTSNAHFYPVKFIERYSPSFSFPGQLELLYFIYVVRAFGWKNKILSFLLSGHILREKFKLLLIFIYQYTIHALCSFPLCLWTE